MLKRDQGEIKMTSVLAAATTRPQADALLLVMAGAVLWYVVRVGLALVLLRLARRHPGYRQRAVRCAPRAVRPLLARALVGSVLTVGVTAGGAWAAPAADCQTTAGGVPALDRADPCPIAEDFAPLEHPGPHTDPVEPSAPPPSPPTRNAPAQPTTMTVVRGDSLWSMAARVLGPGAETGDIARAWPLLWEANRAVLGDNPHLIHPGVLLAVPQALAAEVRP